MIRKLDWNEQEEEDDKLVSKNAKTVILKHMFTLEEIEQDPGVILELKNDVREECLKIGEVTSVMLYDVCF
jgi:HIV Tat-specific factor 1